MGMLMEDTPHIGVKVPFSRLRAVCSRVVDMRAGLGMVCLA